MRIQPPLFGAVSGRFAANGRENDAMTLYRQWFWSHLLSAYFKSRDGS